MTRGITKTNILEIILVPLLFGFLYMGGVLLLMGFGIINYMVHAGWCLGTGGIVISILAVYTYLSLSAGH